MFSYVFILWNITVDVNDVITGDIEVVSPCSKARTKHANLTKH